MIWSQDTLVEIWSFLVIHYSFWRVIGAYSHTMEYTYRQFLDNGTDSKVQLVARHDQSPYFLYMTPCKFNDEKIIKIMAYLYPLKH